MICFSDLDRTLIYSNKFISNSEDELPIEEYEGKDISFVTKKSLEGIKKINEKYILIPTTTRTIEQYERINFKKHNINFEWAIVCNGGYILHNGEVLKEWNNIIRKEMKKSKSFIEVTEEFKKYSLLSGINKIREVEDLFFYIVIDDKKFNDNSLNEFNDFLKKSNWNMYRSGRKIYFMPEVLQKENAVKFLASFLNIDRFYALGDSFMDLNMLRISERAYVPKNSYLQGVDINIDTFIPKEEGLRGIEEILDEIISK